jgi:hypothetical protein
MALPTTREEFEDLVELAGMFADEVVRWGYSGRGMYGDECVGIVCDDEDFYRLIGEVARATEDDDWDWVTKVRTDGMGKNTIFYWERLRLPEDDEEIA